MPILLDSAPCACCAPKRLSSAQKLACYRTSHVPRGAGLKAVRNSQHAIQRDMVRMRRVLMQEGVRHMSKMLHSYFSQKLAELIKRMDHHVNFSSAPIPRTKSSVDLGFGSHEEIWKKAIEDVLGPDADIELVADYLPAVQSIAAKAYSRTSLFLGEGEDPNASVYILRRAQNLAQLVTSINDTTRKQLADEINQSIQDGLTVAETVDSLEESFPQIASSRIPTIARTEVGRAVDEGTKQSFKESSTVKTVKVVGCQAREKNSPQYNGQSTCNITDVPVYDVDKLIFHPNHTGAIVVDAFYDE